MDAGMKGREENEYWSSTPQFMKAFLTYTE